MHSIFVYIYVWGKRAFNVTALADLSLCVKDYLEPKEKVQWEKLAMWMAQEFVLLNLNFDPWNKIEEIAHPSYILTLKNLAFSFLFYFLLYLFVFLSALITHHQHQQHHMHTHVIKRSLNVFASPLSVLSYCQEASLHSFQE